jgi:hypothetical protein
VKPEQLFPKTTVYKYLRSIGITSSIFQHREYTPSSYSNVLFVGANVKGYRSLPAALVDLREAIQNSKGPSYYLCYYDRLDGVSHEYGPGSAQAEAEMQSILHAIRSEIINSMTRTSKKVQFLVTADHGLSETNPATTIYINRDPRFKGIEEFLRINNHGDLINPAGSARDYFLYIKPNLVNEAREFLSQRLEGVADVCKVTDLVSEGFFGPIISPSFSNRVGDLVILPYENESIWWYEKNRFEQKYYGHHGGLTPQEMEIPLLTWNL